MKPTPRPAVLAMQPYVPGKPVEEVQRELGLSDVIKMASNENPLGPSPLALAAAREALLRGHVYPEATSPELRRAVAERWDVAPERVIIGNGSDEIMRLLAETYLEAGDTVVVPAPSFSGYRIVAEIVAARLVTVPLRDWAMDLPAMAAAAQGAKMVFLCSPNNPTGACFDPDGFEAFMAAVPRHTIVVLDEAYREYATGDPFDGRPYLDEYSNLVILRTFSKIYGLAGFRIGYGIADPAVVAPMLTVRDPFSVNVVAQAAGLAALEDGGHVESSRRLNEAGKAYLYGELQRMGLTYVPTEANFILIDLGRPAAPVYEALLRQGVIVRPCASFGLPTCLRVTIGRREENSRFLRALQKALRG